MMAMMAVVKPSTTHVDDEHKHTHIRRIYLHVGAGDILLSGHVSLVKASNALQHLFERLGA